MPLAVRAPRGGGLISRLQMDFFSKPHYYVLYVESAAGEAKLTRE